MDYFKILNLKKEPFSNSPDPDFFFHSNQHVQCLQKLELSIRLRRGLNVVIGEVGTGKTTLCRELIRRFSNEKDKLETHLILDPGFTSPLEFLKAIAYIFGQPVAHEEKSEWQIKEGLKKHLFKQAVNEEKIVTLIIDEGQKLPGFCLEILRELLNYETNEHKLLQVIIFAQREFDEALVKYENFADRIHLYHHLGPLSFKETRDMIHFRLSKAGGDGKALNIFTFIGLWFVYRYSKGYPRKIVNLCSTIILSLILQNRHKAGWLLVRLSAKRTFTVKGFKLQWVGLSAILIALAFDIFFVSLHSNQKKSLQKSISRQVTLPTPGTASARTDDTEIREPLHTEKETSLITEKIVLAPGDTVSEITKTLYGAILPHIVEVMAKNSHIPNINSIKAGEGIIFPFREDKQNTMEHSRLQITISRKKTLEETYRFIKKYPEIASKLLVVPYQNREEGLVFAVMLRKTFKDMETAQTALQHIPMQFAENAFINGNREKNTTYYKAP